MSAAAYKGGGGYSVGGDTMQHLKPRGWEITPRWHWRYWFGYRMRRFTGRLEVGAAFPGKFEYRTFQQHARAVLEEMCEDGRPQQQNPNRGRSPSHIGGPANQGARRTAV